MILGNLFLLIILLIGVILGIAYLYYKHECKKYKKRGFRNPYYYVDYFDCVGDVFSCFLGASFIGVLVYVIITNWNVPIL